MKIAYIHKRFHARSYEIIEQANEIIDNYLEQGLTLTLRQLYYRFVAAGLLPNQQKEYSRLGSIINDGRLAGLIDWTAIEDRGRNLIHSTHWKSPAEIVKAAANSYNVDKWLGQFYRVEVWVEKQALESVVHNACYPYDVACYASKGYNSQSEMWRAAMRFKEYHKQYSQETVIIHLGDHDPSGIDMTRDIRDRLKLFGVPMEINRIALNMDQIQKYDPPPYPAKLTDSRCKGYIAEYGSESWELDALEPAVLRDLIQSTIKAYCDMDIFQEQVDEENRQKKILNKWADNYKTEGEE